MASDEILTLRRFTCAYSVVDFASLVRISRMMRPVDWANHSSDGHWADQVEIIGRDQQEATVQPGCGSEPMVHINGRERTLAPLCVCWAGRMEDGMEGGMLWREREGEGVGGGGADSE